MKTSLQTAFAISLLFFGLSRSVILAAPGSQTRVQVRSITGTYKYVLNSVEVLELPGNMVRISFAGFWPNDRKRAETRNVGTFDETVPMSGHKATVKIQYGHDPCTITLDFRSNKVIVGQEGSILGCGFGFNVEAEGTYAKTSSKPPSFPPR